MKVWQITLVASIQALFSQLTRTPDYPFRTPVTSELGQRLDGVEQQRLMVERYVTSEPNLSYPDARRDLLDPC